VSVVADLEVLRSRLRQAFPDASLKLSNIRDHVVVEGQARDVTQVARIVETIQAFLISIQNAQLGSSSSGGGGGPPARMIGGLAGAGADAPPPPPVPVTPNPAGVGSAPSTNPQVPAGEIIPGGGAGGPVSSVVTRPVVINLIRVPTSQQVLLKVRVAELNRTSLRAIGGDFFANIPEFGALLGTRIGGATVSAPATITNTTVTGAAATGLGPVPSSTLFGIFSGAHFEFILTALRRNTLLKILAEPNLVALNGHQASFLAGGEFPVPVPQANAGVVGGTTVTVQFREFGVRLGFVPIVLDNESIRLTVDPEVSTIDFSLGTIIVPGGSPVPGLNTRKSHTTVELKQGQTLAIAGLMQLTLDGSTTRIPVLGDLPYIGPFFSNTTGDRVEKELVVLVTPYLIEPLNPGQVPPGPGDEVRQPSDLEFFLLNRIEGRTGIDYRATTLYDDPLKVVRHHLLERKYLLGPCGYSD
jgi:pilus assembly protein CpaC